MHLVEHTCRNGCRVKHFSIKSLMINTFQIPAYSGFRKQRYTDIHLLQPGFLNECMMIHYRFRICVSFMEEKYLLDAIQVKMGKYLPTPLIRLSDIKPAAKTGDNSLFMIKKYPGRKIGPAHTRAHFAKHLEYTLGFLIIPRKHQLHT